jgi:group I intron endonuclease
MIIYKITNLVNGKIYIGQTTQSIETRWRQHCSKSEGCIALVHAIQKYGRENFTVEQIDVASDRDELDEKEKYWIEHYDCIAPKGYNLTSGGTHYKVSEETRKKHRAIRGEKHPMFGKHLSEEHKKKLSIAFSGSKNHQYGKRMSPEHKEKLRRLSIGRIPSEETRYKMRLARLGEKNHFYGKTHTKEARIKMSNARKKYAGEKHPGCRSVRCLETGVVYPYIRKASQETGVHETHISSCCKGKLPHAGHLHWEYV